MGFLNHQQYHITDPWEWLVVLMFTLPETKRSRVVSHLNMDGFLFGAFRPIFRGTLAVSLRECIFLMFTPKNWGNDSPI